MASFHKSDVIGFTWAWIFLILFQFCVPPAQAEDGRKDRVPFGRIVSFKGDVRLNDKPLYRATRVFHGDILKTGAGKAMIEDHSSYFTIGPFTRIVLGFPLNKKGVASHIELIRGTLRSVIDKFAAPSFRLDTPSAVMGIRGTDFLVHAGQKASVAFTKKGRVSFSSGGKTVLMEKLEMTQGGEKITPITPEPIGPNATLKGLLKEVEQFCDLRIPPSLSARKDLNNIIARYNLNYASYLIDKKAFSNAMKLCALAFAIADLRELKAEALLKKGTISFTFKGEEIPALNDLDRILEYYPDTPSAEQALYFKGLIYYHQKAHDKARKALDAYMEQYPEGMFKENARSILEHLKGE